jgi:hypothetical protein
VFKWKSNEFYKTWNQSSRYWVRFKIINLINYFFFYYRPLAKASFEETKEIIRDAARFGQKDTIQGVTSAIMVGSVPRIGTGCIDVFLDTSKLINAKPITFTPTEEYNELLKKISQQTKPSNNHHVNKQTDYFLSFDNFDE